MKGSMPRRLTVVLALLLLGYGLFVTSLAWRAAAQQEQETQQRLSRGLAQHIVDHWPQLRAGGPEDKHARQELLRMLMTVNPAIQVYVLDSTGHVDSYIGEPGMVRQAQVDVAPLRAFLAGAALPLGGTDPMGSGELRNFSAGMFPPRGDGLPAGYLYIVLESPGRTAVVARLGSSRLWQGLAWAAVAGLVLALFIGLLAFRSLTKPLNRLAAQMRAFDLRQTAPLSPQGPQLPQRGDEVATLAQTFQSLTGRLGEQHEQQRRQSAAHREVIANVAHDLRTPLTALHGHLEALRAGASVFCAARSARQLDVDFATQHVETALTQSDKLRSLTQQLFELATLQSMDQVVHSERFRLDEVVADAVQKFELLAPPRRVALAGAEPGPVEFDGDLHLIERALTNLIDNAVRHTPADTAVQVSLRCNAQEVSVLVEDLGPGLPAELTRRLDAGDSVRDPAVRRHAGGGMGGLGLAIAQRIAVLHGGRLHTLPAPQGGARLCLAFPRPAMAMG